MRQPDQPSSRRGLALDKARARMSTNDKSSAAVAPEQPRADTQEPNPLIEVQQPQNLLLYRGRRRPGRQRRRLHHPRGRGHGPGRRVRLRQERHLALDHAPDRRLRQDRRRSGLLRRPQPAPPAPKTRWSRSAATALSMIFQQPTSCLNPVFRSATRSPRCCRSTRAWAARKPGARPSRLLRMVGIPDPERRAKAFPHEMSGGQAQRVHDRHGPGLPSRICSSPTSPPPPSM